MRTWLFICCLILVVSCKKEGDTTAPTVNIVLPVDGLQANVTDIIHVKVDIADDVALSRLEVRLVTLSQIAVMPVVQLSTSGTGGSLEMDYALDDITLESGQYYLEAKVFDESGNESHDFVLLNITAVPKVLQGVFAVTTGSGFADIHKINTSWTSAILGSFQSDFTDLAVSSWWQQVGITGAYTGMFRCISLDGVRPSWTINAIPSAGPFWGGVFTNGKDWYLNFRSDEFLKKYAYTGSNGISYTANTGYHFGNCTFSGEKLFAETEDFAGTSRLMSVFVSGGGAVQQAVMNVQSVAVLPRDATTVYVAGNTNGQGKLLIYDYDLNGFWEPIALPAGQVFSATQVDVNTLLIAMDNGFVYKFTYAPVGLLQWIGATAQHIRYDEAGGTVITAEGVSIKQYDYPGVNVLHTVALPDTAQDIELWYNR